MPLSVVILAAGQGKRMNSDLPKVLQPLAGQPLLKHVIRTARALEPANIYVVYGHGGAQVQAVLDHENVDWILQAEQLGTGHAVMQAMSIIPDEHTVLVLYGDVPLIGADSLKKLIAAAGEGALAILSVNLDEAAGYGRIVRDAEGHVSAIVEQARQAQRSSRFARPTRGSWPLPPGVCGNGCWAWAGTTIPARVLSDRCGGAGRAGGDRVDAVSAANAAEVMGVNDKIQLAQVEACHRLIQAHELMLAGATLADPARIDIRGDVHVERDVFIESTRCSSAKYTCRRASSRAQLHHSRLEHRRRYRDPRELRHRQRRCRRALPNRTIRTFAARYRPASGRACRQFRRSEEE